MRHRELVERQLDVALGNIQKLRFIVNQNQPLEVYIQTLAELQEQLEEIQSVVRREQLDPQEGFGLY